MLNVLLFVFFLLLLLQIIERFKDVVGVGSCGLSFLFTTSSSSPSPLVSWLCLAFGAHLVSSLLLVCYFVYNFISNQAIKTINMCQSKHKLCSCQQYPGIRGTNLQLWDRLSFEPWQLNLQRRLCNIACHIIAVIVSWWPRQWVKQREITGRKKLPFDSFWSPRAHFAQSYDF